MVVSLSFVDPALDEVPEAVHSDDGREDPVLLGQVPGHRSWSDHSQHDCKEIILLISSGFTL